MSARRTSDDRYTIDALNRIKRLKSSQLAFNAVADLLERGLLDRSGLAIYRSSEFMRGFRDGVDDANGVAS